MKHIVYVAICLLVASPMTPTQLKTPTRKDSSTDLMYCMLSLVRSKMETISASDALYTAAKKGCDTHNTVAQNIDEAATEFIACLTQEIKIEQSTTQMIKPKQLNPPLLQILEEMYALIPNKFKSSALHRSSLSLTQRLFDSIKQADQQTLIALWEFLATQYRRSNPDNLNPLV